MTKSAKYLTQCGWLMLGGEAGGPRLTERMVFSEPFHGASPMPKAHGRFYIPKPRPTSADRRRAERATVFSGGDYSATMRHNDVAGGYADQLTIAGPGIATTQLLNNGLCYQRGMAAGMNFTRDGVLCRPRTNGSTYSGDRLLHAYANNRAWYQTDTDPPPPGSETPWHDAHEPSPAWNPEDAQGACLIESSSGANTATSVVIPVELDPDGYCGGGDKGILEDLGPLGDTTVPEMMIPVLYACKVATTYTKHATLHNVIVVTTTWEWFAWDSAGARTTDVTVVSPWRVEPVALYAIAEDGVTMHAWDKSDDLSASLATIPLGGDFHGDQGQVYEMTSAQTKRGAAVTASSLIGSNLGAVILDGAGWAVGIGNPLAGAAGRVWSWANRMDRALPGGDATPETDRAYYRIAFGVETANAPIPKVFSETCFIAYGATAAEVATAFNSI